MVGLLAAWLLAAHLLDCWWLVLPSVRGLSHNWMWLTPLAALGLVLLAWSAIKERVHA
jgi:hypothetical protein